MELEAMTRYTSPVNPAVFPHLTVVLLAIGMFFTAWFFVYPFSGQTPSFLHPSQHNGFCVKESNNIPVESTSHSTGKGFWI
ncbi:unnamed protein product [Gadus morhua 'NCC']